MSLIEAGARGGAITVLLLLMVLLLRDGRSALSARIAALYALSAAATMVAGAPSLAIDQAWMYPFNVFMFGSPAILWLLAAVMFDDEFVPSGRHAITWVALVALGFLGVIHGGAGFLPFNVLRLLCVLLALWSALAGRAEDLVEPRRQMRVIFVVVVALFNAVIILSFVLSRGGHDTPLGLVDAIGSLTLTFFFAAFILALDGSGTLLSPTTGTPKQPAAALPPLEPAPVAPPADERELAILAALRRQMEEDRAYREAALNITTLAGRLGVPEYRLRRLINQRLGYRNFSAFLNSYRLADVTEALSDDSQAAVPILTIALDAGFQSVGPFNRAFKAETGMTPSEFRRMHAQTAGKVVAVSKISMPNSEFG